VAWYARTTPLDIFLLGILIFKWLTARRLYQSFGVKGLTVSVRSSALITTLNDRNKHHQTTSQNFILNDTGFAFHNFALSHSRRFAE
jgi:hypothetical protein